MINYLLGIKMTQQVARSCCSELRGCFSIEFDRPEEFETSSHLPPCFPSCFPAYVCLMQVARRLASERCQAASQQDVLPLVFRIANVTILVCTSPLSLLCALKFAFHSSRQQPQSPPIGSNRYGCRAEQFRIFEVQVIRTGGFHSTPAVLRLSRHMR